MMAMADNQWIYMYGTAKQLDYDISSSPRVQQVRAVPLDDFDSLLVTVHFVINDTVCLCLLWLSDGVKANVSQRAGTDPCTTLGSALFRCSSFLAYTPNWPVALFLLQLHPHGTLYLLTFDGAKTFSLSNVTWKPIYSNSLSPPVLHQAPLYLWT